MNEDKFTGLATLYAAHRPTYPETLFDYLSNQGILCSGMTIADIGAGTGIFSKALLARDCQVLAVEPNNDMRQEMIAWLGDNPNFTAINASAEATTLADHSVQAITVAQAFHWFDRERFQLECQRILKKDCFVALVWNDRDSSAAVVSDLFQINKKYCPNFRGFSGDTLTTGRRDFAGFFRQGQYSQEKFPFTAEQNEDEFVGRTLSASYALRPDQTNYTDYIAELRQLFNQYAANSRLVTPMHCSAYWGLV